MNKQKTGIFSGSYCGDIYDVAHGTLYFYYLPHPTKPFYVLLRQGKTIYRLPSPSGSLSSPSPGRANGVRNRIHNLPNQCQRSAEFMAYICEEAEFHLIQFFFLLQRFLFLHTNHQVLLHQANVQNLVKKATEADV